jgi:type VI secretion system protein ImpK
MTTPADVKPSQFRWSEIIDPNQVKEESPFNYLVPKVATYYRSKAFVSQVNINPLIAASAPLFFLIEKIRSLQEAPDSEKLHNDLIHEINAFEHQAQANGYRSYVILAARYVLCLWIDQTILNTSWSENVEWEKMRLTDNQETDKGNPFYLLVNRCLQDATIYIELLELFYLCISLGFQVNSPSLELNSIRLTETRDCLFEVINRHREGYSKRLEVAAAAHSPRKNFSFRPLLRPAVIIFSAFILVCSYFILNTNLETPMSGVVNSTF